MLFLTLMRMLRSRWSFRYAREGCAALVALVAASAATLWGWALGGQGGVVPWWSYALVCGISVFLLAYAFFPHWKGLLPSSKWHSPALAAEDELQVLKNAHNEQRDFLANVSHELKTTVFLLQGFMDALSHEKKGLNKTQRRLLKRAQAQAEILQQLVEDLLVSALMEQGSVPMRMASVALQPLCRTLMASFSKMARHQKVELLFEAPNTPLNVCADKRYLEQVLRNLLDNAIAYNRPNGQVRLRLQLQPNEQVAVSVIDTGIGIAPEEQTRIFERFYRVEKSRNKAQGGMGIGLSLVKHILAAHGQPIVLHSELKQGSEFAFQLPLHAARS